MALKKRPPSPCWVCGHARFFHVHDEGVSVDNEGQSDPGHCRVQLCACKGYNGDAPGNSGDIEEGPA